MKNFKFSSSANGKVFRNGLYSTAILAAAIVLAVLINLLVGAIPKKYTEFDLSAAKMYTLGDSSRQLMQSLAQDVTVYYLCETGSEDAIITKLLDHYADESGHFHWEQKDPALYPTFAAQYGAEDALCQHRSQQRQQRNRHRAELQKRLLVFHKIEVQHLRDGDGTHSVIADADAAGDSLGHAGESLGGGAEILHLLPEPQPECRGHAAQCRCAGAYRAAQPAAGGGQVSVNAKGLHECAAKRDLAQNQKGGDKLKPAHAADKYRQRHQPKAPAGRAAFAHGNAAKQQRRQHRQQPGPQAPVQVFHTPLGPGGKHNGHNPDQRSRRACLPPGSQRQQQLGCVKQDAVYGVQPGLPRLAAGLYQTKRAVKQPECPALQAGLVGVGLEILGVDRRVFPEPGAVLAVAPVLGIHPHKAAGGGLVVFHLEHPAKHQRLGAGIPKAGGVGAGVLPPVGQQRRQQHHRQQGKHPPQPYRQAGKWLMNRHKLKVP